MGKVGSRAASCFAPVCLFCVRGPIIFQPLHAIWVYLGASPCHGSAECFFERPPACAHHRMAFATVFFYLHQLLSHCWRCSHSTSADETIRFKEWKLPRDFLYGTYQLIGRNFFMRREIWKAFFQRKLGFTHEEKLFCGESGCIAWAAREREKWFFGPGHFAVARRLMWKIRKATHVHLSKGSARAASRRKLHVLCIKSYFWLRRKIKIGVYAAPFHFPSK